MKRKNGKPGQELLEKVEQLIEEKPKQDAQAPEFPTPEASPPEAEKPGRGPRREQALLTYISLLFGVSFVLVLLSFLLQQQDISELNQSASSALARAEQLQDNNRELTQTNQDLQTQLADLQAQLESESAVAQEELETANRQINSLEEELTQIQAQTEQQQEAYELLCSALLALSEERSEDFQRDMTALAALADMLDSQGKAVYQQLLAATAAES